MRKFHIKSLVLGVGIGIVITSVVSMIYLAGMDPSKALSEEEIVKLASQYGMVHSTSVLTEPPSLPEKERVNSKVEEEEPKVEEEKHEEIEVSIRVVYGDSSEKVADKLFNAGLIESKEAFIKELVDSGLTRSIRVGEYSIRKGLDIKDIIDIITKRRKNIN
jgi:hypothetical protein